LVLTDLRLKINNGINNKLQTVLFESDHVTIYFKLTIDNNEIEMNVSKHNTNLNFNKIN